MENSETSNFMLDIVMVRALACSVDSKGSVFERCVGSPHHCYFSLVVMRVPKHDPSPQIIRKKKLKNKFKGRAIPSLS